jgi:hypothetical protein
MITTNHSAVLKVARTIALSGAMSLSMGLLSGALPVRAQGDNDPHAGEVAVGGKTVLTIRLPSEGMTIKERAEAVSNRLVTILADPDLKASDIVAVPLGRNAAKIMVKNQLLVTIDPQTARINQAKPLVLAQIWVDHLRRVLPRVNVKPNPGLGEPPKNNESGQIKPEGGGSPK